MDIEPCQFPVLLLHGVQNSTLFVIISRRRFCCAFQVRQRQRSARKLHLMTVYILCRLSSKVFCDTKRSSHLRVTKFCHIPSPISRPGHKFLRRFHDCLCSVDDCIQRRYDAIGMESLCLPPLYRSCLPGRRTQWLRSRSIGSNVAVSALSLAEVGTPFQLIDTLY